MFEAPFLEHPQIPNIPYPATLESMVYIFVADIRGLSSFRF